MDDRIRTILDELYEADPSLKKDEARLIPVLKKLMKGRRDVAMDGNFRKKLRGELAGRTGERMIKAGPWRPRVFALSAAAAAMVAAALFLPVAFRKAGGAAEAAVMSMPAEKSMRLESTKIEPMMDMMVMEESEAPMVMGSSAPDFNTENYSYIEESGFLKVADTPLSTFSIDVDTASYANVRRFLYDGMLPPADAVRIEELINYFNYDYAGPEGDRPFSINTELTAAPWNRENLLLRIGLQGKKISFADLPPDNLVFLLDVSGSMDDPGKLPLLKKAMRMIVDHMRDSDRISIVVYAGAAGTVLEPTGGNEKEAILEALDRLEAGGSTAGAQGIELAYRKAMENFDSRGNNRIILATDGDFNVGQSSDGELVRLIEEKRKSGISLTVLGFGTGNLKDSRMEQLADKGNGNYAYIDSLLEARKVLVEEMGGTFFTIAGDVKLQVEFNPAVVESYRLIGYENRMLNREDFNDDTKDAGELGAGHSVTALYELVPAGSSGESTSLKYQSSEVKPEALSGKEALTVSLRYKDPGSDVSKLIEQPVENRVLPFDESDSDLRFAASVALWGMLLRESQYSGEGNYSMVLDLAGKSKGDDPEGYRSEFIRLVRLSRDLAGGNR